MTTSTTISITANGKLCAVAPGTPLPDFLRSLDLAPTRVIVEHNRQALTQAEAQAVRLAEGDQLEIVRLVAGG